MAKREGPWVRFFASDWLAGTRGMTAAETGVYITLIATMYEKAEPIVRDDARLARLCGLPTRNFAIILDRLIDDEKITLEGEKLWGRKVELEVRNRSARAERSTNAALAKHQQNQGQFSASAQRPQPPSSPQTVPRARVSEPEPDKESNSDELPKKNARGSRLPTDWKIPIEWGQWTCTTFGVSTDRVLLEADKFKDHWIAKAGKDATKIDWQATWRTWCRRAFERYDRAPIARRQSEADLIDDMLHQADKEHANANRPHTARANQTPLLELSNSELGDT